jgi:hypothetical protein
MAARGDISKRFGRQQLELDYVTYSDFADFDRGFLRYCIGRFTPLALMPVIGKIWIVSLRDVKDVVAFDCVLLPATFLRSGRTAPRFTSR